MVKKGELSMYKGRPLVRSGNTIYYGSMGDKCVAMLQIMDSSSKKDLEVAGKCGVVTIQE